MIEFFGKVFCFVMNIIYMFFKLKKTENKIAFISRQSETPSLDFRSIIEEIKKEYPQYKVVVLCKMIPSGFGGKIAYIGEMFRQMNALATSKVAVLDGYCITACVLNHKNDLKIIQIWHALGAFKRFAKSILDKEGGASSKTAKAFKMHRNYDLIAASGDKCVPFFSEAFGQPEEKFIPIGIPRMDYLTDENAAAGLREKIYSAYPFLNNGKKNILYAPTFRDREEDRDALKNACEQLSFSVDYSAYNLIIKHHVVDSNREEIFAEGQKTVGELFTGMDFMAVADAVITDYSSIIYEALLKNLPIYIFCFDSDKYIDERGFYIDFFNDLPAVYSDKADDMCKKIEEGITASPKKTQQFIKDYVNKKFPSVTKVYGEIIDELMRGVYDNRYNYTGGKNE